MSNDILVVGRYDNSYKIYEFINGYRNQSINPPMPSDDPGNPDNDYAGDIVVTARITTPANATRVKEAAKRVAEAVLRIKERLLATSLIFIVIQDRQVSTADLLADLENTEWIVTNETVFGNAGVGQAKRNTSGGMHTDTINFEAVLGSSNPPTFGYSVGYPNGEGMNAIILHELAHISYAGYDFYISSVNVYNNAINDKKFTGDFYPSKYSKNVEAYADDLMLLIADAIGSDITTSQGPVMPGGQSNAQHPDLL